jgi:hypothetical protein
MSVTVGLTLQGSMDSWPLLTSSIWSTAKTHRAELTPLMAMNQELHQRYLALHGLHGYFDSALPSSYSPHPYVALGVQELFPTHPEVHGLSSQGSRPLPICDWQ